MKETTLMKLLRILEVKGIMPQQQGEIENDPNVWVTRAFEDVSGITEHKKDMESKIRELERFGYTVTENE